MSDDPDLPKANYALQVLRQARLSRNETAARMVEHLAYVTTNTGLRPPEIEETQQAARVAYNWSSRIAGASNVQTSSNSDSNRWFDS